MIERDIVGAQKGKRKHPGRQFFISCLHFIVVINAIPQSVVVRRVTINSIKNSSQSI